MQKYHQIFQEMLVPYNKQLDQLLIGQGFAAVAYLEGCDEEEGVYDEHYTARRRVMCAIQFRFWSAPHRYETLLRRLLEDICYKGGKSKTPQI